MDNPQALYENSHNVAPARIVVGTKTANISIHDKTARMAASVFPYPTSPTSRRSIGFILCMSSLITATLRSWSCVSVYGKACSEFLLLHRIAAKRIPFSASRLAYNSMSSSAISLILATLRSSLTHSAPPNLLSFGTLHPTIHIFERA